MISQKGEYEFEHLWFCNLKVHYIGFTINSLLEEIK